MTIEIIDEEDDLIPPREALKILPWTSATSLRLGAMGTNGIRRHRIGNRILYSKRDCQELRRSVLSTPAKKLYTRPMASELV
jgi:hypothetical protein